MSRCVTLNVILKMVRALHAFIILIVFWLIHEWLGPRFVDSADAAGTS